MRRARQAKKGAKKVRLRPPVRLVHGRNGVTLRLSPERRQALLTLCEQLGISFRRLDLLNIALTHPSFCAEFNQGSVPSNQRLEFLGDAVLGLIVSDYLYHTYPCPLGSDLASNGKRTLCHLHRPKRLG